ncbi:hypothetical protein H9P43_000534 [Blastocladiella emersonii ATCC 22665]|nr:hypothetical protein H9P43_000534 [Blastocladiella emersonii ATCC 22665]
MQPSRNSHLNTLAPPTKRPRLASPQHQWTSDTESHVASLTHTSLGSVLTSRPGPSGTGAAAAGVAPGAGNGSDDDDDDDVWHADSETLAAIDRMVLTQTQQMEALAAAGTAATARMAAPTTVSASFAAASAAPASTNATETQGAHVARAVSAWSSQRAGAAPFMRPSQTQNPAQQQPPPLIMSLPPGQQLPAGAVLVAAAGGANEESTALREDLSRTNSELLARTGEIAMLRQNLARLEAQRTQSETEANRAAAQLREQHEREVADLRAEMERMRSEMAFHEHNSRQQAWRASRVVYSQHPAQSQIPVPAHPSASASSAMDVDVDSMPPPPLPPPPAPLPASNVAAVVPVAPELLAPPSPSTTDRPPSAASVAVQAINESLPSAPTAPPEPILIALRDVAAASPSCISASVRDTMFILAARGDADALCATSVFLSTLLGAQATIGSPTLPNLLVGTARVLQWLTDSLRARGLLAGLLDAILDYAASDPRHIISVLHEAICACAAHVNRLHYGDDRAAATSSPPSLTKGTTSTAPSPPPRDRLEPWYRAVCRLFAVIESIARASRKHLSLVARVAGPFWQRNEIEYLAKDRDWSDAVHAALARWMVLLVQTPQTIASLAHRRSLVPFLGKLLRVDPPRESPAIAPPADVGGCEQAADNAEREFGIAATHVAVLEVYSCLAAHFPVAVSWHWMAVDGIAARIVAVLHDTASQLHSAPPSPCCRRVTRMRLRVVSLAMRIIHSLALRMQQSTMADPDARRAALAALDALAKAGGGIPSNEGLGTGAPTAAAFPLLLEDLLRQPLGLPELAKHKLMSSIAMVHALPGAPPLPSASAGAASSVAERSAARRLRRSDPAGATEAVAVVCTLAKELESMLISTKHIKAPIPPADPVTAL